MSKAPSPQKPANAGLRLAKSTAAESPAQTRAWKLLIVDDEPEIHHVTKLALDGIICRGRPLEFISAYSGAEACQIARDVPDIAVILLDVVMETDHAGLDCVRYVREELNNRFVRIILRTGQPGQAPEHRVITDYDINDYKHKTELTRQRLFTTIHTSISSYRDLIALENNRRGLEEVIEASARIFDLREMGRFIEGVLEQLTALLYLDQNALVLRASALAAEGHSDGACEIVAGIGSYHDFFGKDISECLDSAISERIHEARKQQGSIFGTDYYVGFHRNSDNLEHLLYVSGSLPLSVPDRHLIDLFIRNVSIAQTNVHLLSQAQSRQAEPDPQ